MSPWPLSLSQSHPWCCLLLPPLHQDTHSIIVSFLLLARQPASPRGFVLRGHSSCQPLKPQITGAAWRWRTTTGTLPKLSPCSTSSFSSSMPTYLFNVYVSNWLMRLIVYPCGLYYKDTHKAQRYAHKSQPAEAENELHSLTTMMMVMTTNGWGLWIAAISQQN